MINVPRLPTAVTGPQQTHGCGWNGLRWGGEERSIPFAPLAHRHRPSGSVSLTLSSCAKHFLIGLRVGATSIGVGRIAQILERPPTPSSPPLVMRIDYRVNALITHSCALIHTHAHSCTLSHTIQLAFARRRRRRRRIIPNRPFGGLTARCHALVFAHQSVGHSRLRFALPLGRLSHH